MFREIKEEVFYADAPVVKVTAETIAFLKARATGNRRRRARLCAHPGTEDALHEMLIVHAKHAYVPPHKHIGKSESFHIIEGRLKVVLFDDGGNKTDEIAMGDVASGRTFFYRLSEARFHTVIPETDWVVFHEVTNGPFDRADTLFAPWAPGEDDDEAAAQRAFVRSLL